MKVLWRSMKRVVIIRCFVGCIIVLYKFSRDFGIYLVNGLVDANAYGFFFFRIKLSLIYSAEIINSELLANPFYILIKLIPTI